jgi:lipopolysaccharide export system protein LptA
MMRISSKIHAALLLAVLVFSAAVRAERADKDAAMNAEADFARRDELKQTTHLKGNVTISKGTIRIRAAVVDVKLDQDGYEIATAMADAGKRVFFRQKREGLDEFIEAEAETMEYNARADTVQFSRNAVLRRYRGATLFDEVSGSGIFYDNKTESFSVDNAPGAVAAASAPAGSGRVRLVLTPRPAASAASAAPGAPAQLRPSSALGGTR